MQPAPKLIIYLDLFGIAFVAAPGAMAVTGKPIHM
jgi:hypothetical protein